MNKFFTVLSGALVLLAIIAACGSIPFVAQNEPTATATRRVRPTFTPKPPRPTPTEQVEPTLEPEPTDEPTATEEPETATPIPATPTKQPVVQQPKPTNPPQPTAPPEPQFLIKFGSNYLCEQQGVYKVIINAKSGRSLMAGATFGIFDQAGNLLEDGAGKKLIGVTQGDFNVSIGSNCRLEADRTSPNTSNGELDVVDAVRAGNNPLILRFIKSADDLTPISENLLINFGQGGQYWIYTNTQ